MGWAFERLCGITICAIAAAIGRDRKDRDVALLVTWLYSCLTAVACLMLAPRAQQWYTDCALRLETASASASTRAAASTSASSLVKNPGCIGFEEKDDADCNSRSGIANNPLRQEEMRPLSQSHPALAGDANAGASAGTGAGASGRGGNTTYTRDPRPGQ